MEPPPLRSPAPKEAPRHGHVIMIGRAATNDIVLQDESVSARHARVEVNGEGAWVEDLGSKNGTFIEGSPARVDRARFGSGHSLRFGQAVVSAAELLRAFQPAAPVQKKIGRPIRLVPGQQVKIGRNPACEIRIDSPRASAYHASACLHEGRVVITDLGSTNGTFIDDVPIRGAAPLQPGAVLTIAGTRFGLGPDPATLMVFDSVGEEVIEALQLAVMAGRKLLIDRVSLVVQPGELVAVMGPSGAGKSTLLALLNGSTTPASGSVRIGGVDLHRHFDLFRGRIGFVPQDDIMHGNLTVNQALRYAARLRLPRDFSAREIHRRVAQVIQQLGLEGTENTRIGDEHQRGISGGQRKRVNVALELMSDPATLILDEPTSGLSSADAASMMELLRSLAAQGKTVIVTIHQPSMEVFSHFDAVAIVARDASTQQVGRLAWYGRAAPDSLKFFGANGMHVDGLLQALARRPVMEWVERWEHSQVRHQWVTGRISRGHSARAGRTPRRPMRKYRLLQLFTLIRRTFAVKVGDGWNTALLLLQPPLIGILIVAVFAKALGNTPTVEDWTKTGMKTPIALFVTALAAIWFGISASAREIVSEWPIFRRERMVGLSLFSYVASKVGVALVLAALQSLFLLGIVAWGCNFAGDWWLEYRLLLAAAATGAAIGLVVSAVARTAEAAAGALPILLLPMIVLGGVLMPLEDLPEATQPFCSLMPSRWAFEGLLNSEAPNRPRLRPAPPASNAAAPVLVLPEIVPATAPLEEGDRDVAEHCFPRKSGRTAPEDSFLILAAMASLGFASVGLSLKFRELRARR